MCPTERTLPQSALQRDPARGSSSKENERIARIDGDELFLTHEFLVVMLGVRRAGVTTALHQLESLGLISRGRGTLAVVDRHGLEESTNGLYGVAEAEYDRLFPSP